MSALSNVVGFDDAPFPRDFGGYVPVVGAVYASERLDGVLVGRVKKDGFDSAEALRAMIHESKFREHIQLLFLQGVTLGGFNVVDVHRLHDSLGLPVIVVSRRQPDFDRIRETLLTHVPMGAHKWAIIERLGPMRAVADVFIQSVGIEMQDAEAAVRRFCIHSNIPEPVRTAHLIAGAIAEGESRGRP